MAIPQNATPEDVDKADDATVKEWIKEITPQMIHDYYGPKKELLKREPAVQRKYLKELFRTVNNIEKSAE